jgi:hypothetical protein
LPSQKLHKILLFILLFSAYLLSQNPALLACSSGCDSDSCVPEIIFWHPETTSETTMLSPLSALDAGWYIGVKARDMMRTRSLLKVAFEIADESQGDEKQRAAAIESFTKGFIENINYIKDETIAVFINNNSKDSLYLKTANQVRTETAADILVTCKLMGGKTLVQEKSGKTAEVLLTRTEETSETLYRVMISALSGSDANTPLFIDEVTGKHTVVQEYLTGSKENRLIYREKLFGHYPGLDNFENIAPALSAFPNEAIPGNDENSNLHQPHQHSDQCDHQPVSLDTKEE